MTGLPCLQKRKKTVDEKLSEGDILTADQIVAIARQLFNESGDSQEILGGKVERNQAQISRALKGESRYLKTCVDIIEVYTECSIQFPVGRVISVSDE